MDKIQNKEKTVGVKFILGWILGLMFFLLGTYNFFKNPVVSVFEILAALVVFPPFMEFVAKKTGIKLSTVLRIVIFVVLLGIGVGLNPNKTSSSQTTQTSTEVIQATPTPAPIVFSMSDLIDQYSKNKISVQNKYTGKQLQLNGFIQNISSDVLSGYYLDLAPTNDQFYFGITVKCYFVDQSTLVSLSKGQSITVNGTLQDTSYDTWIELHDCSLVK